MTRLLSLIAAAILCVVLLSIGVSQEPPIGSLKGHLTMEENGKPLAEQMVSIEPVGKVTTDDEDEELKTPSYDTTDKDGVYEFTRLPAGAYRLTASTNAHTVKAHIVTVEEGKATTEDLSAEPGYRHLEIYAGKRVFTPEQKPSAELHGFIEGDSVHVQVYRLAPEEVVQRGGFSQALSGWTRSEIEKPVDPEIAKPIQDIQHKITKRDVEGVFIEPLELPKLTEGVYWIHCAATKGLSANVVLNVTRIALVTKGAQNMALCYVTDLVSGEPIAGAEIMRKGGGSVVADGKTDRDGLLQTQANGSNQTVLFARQGNSVALCDFWSSGQSSNGQTRIFTYTERPVYRPGDTVFFKGVVRKIDGVDYRLPGSGQAKVELLDPSDNVVSKTSLPVSSRGSFNGSFETSTEADPGSYHLRISALGGTDDHYFPLAAYRKPEFTVTVKPDQPWVIFGDRGSATVECKYYFGGPVVGAKVKATVYRSPHYDAYVDEDGEEYEGYEGDAAAGEYSQEIETVTNENGKAVISFATKTEGDPAALESDYDYSVSASVTEPGEKYESGDGKVLVVQAAHALDITSEIFIASVGDTVPITVSTSSHETPSRPVPGQTVIVVVGREEWQNGVSNFIQLDTRTVTTGEDGKATVDVPVTKLQSLTIRASSKDSEGHEAKNETSLYVLGDRQPPSPKAGKLSLTLDRKTYDEGQKAKVVIQTDAPGGMALVTVEADSILTRQVVPLTSEATAIDLPVAHDFLPNAFVNVAYVRNSTFMEASKRLVVDLGVKVLQVSVSPDRPNVKPGETVNLRVKTTNPDGKPESAEVSVGVVDESIYAIREDSTNPIRTMYPRRYNAVNTSYSFAEVYLDGGDKSPANIPVRRKFLDTAFWRPSVMTGRDGTASIRVKLPDNLTSWRATVVGVTDQTAVGIGTGSFKARKDLMVRLELPTFMVQGDSQRVVAIVNNDTGRDADVHVSLQVEGAAADGDRSTSVRVPAGVPQSVSWTLNAPDSGRATLTAKAWIDNGPNDGVELTVPIAPHGRLTRQSDSGQAKGSQVIPLKWLPNADPTTGGLTVVVSPGLMGISQSSLAALVDFPYGCVEQTMSRFLPAVLVEKLVSDRDVASKVPKIAADGMTRLDNMQHEDGGWGWWENDESDPFMTAYVLDGLALAKDAGYASNQVDTKKALDWGAKRLATPTKEDIQRELTYLAFAMTRYGEKQASAGFLAKQALPGSDPSAIAYAAMAYDQLGDTARRDALVDRLLAMKQAGPVGTNAWPNGPEQWGEEGTAVPLRAVATFRPNDPVIPRAIQYLMRRRNGDTWYSTRDTAAILIAFSSYLGKVPEPSKETTVTVTLNGRTLKSFLVTPNEKNPTRLDVPLSGLQKGDNRLEIRTTGDLPVFYSTELRQYDIQPELAAQDSPNIAVRRSYRMLAPRRDRAGLLRLLPSGDPVTEAQSGDAIQCQLVVVCKDPVSFAMVEDPIPSNCRVTERTGLDEGESWGWWWSNLTIRDDRVAFFADQLKPGENKFAYMLQAESPGLSRALPTLVQNMYDPTTAAWSAETRLDVKQ